MFETDDLKVYIEEHAYSPELQFREHARALIQRYLSLDAIERAHVGGYTASGWFTVGRAWTRPTVIPSKPKKGATAVEHGENEETTGKSASRTQSSKHVDEPYDPFEGD